MDVLLLRISVVQLYIHLKKSSYVFELKSILSVALHESGTRNALLSPLLVLKITQLQDKCTYVLCDIKFKNKLNRDFLNEMMQRQIHNHRLMYISLSAVLCIRKTIRKIQRM
jgi:hypothetical protein